MNMLNAVGARGGFNSRFCAFVSRFPSLSIPRPRFTSVDSFGIFANFDSIPDASCAASAIFANAGANRFASSIAVISSSRSSSDIARARGRPRVSASRDSNSNSNGRARAVDE